MPQVRQSPDGAGTRRGGGGFGRRDGFPGARRTDADDEVGGGQLDLDPPRLVAAEAQVDVVPEDGGVEVLLGGGAGQDARVGVAFDDFQPRFQGRLVEQPAELAEPAADGRDQAAFAQFAAGGEAFRLRGAAELTPEAEHVSGRNLHAVEGAGGLTEVLDLAGGEREFLGRKVAPQRGADFGDHRGIGLSAGGGMARRARREFPEPAAKLKHAGFQVEDQRLQPAGR
jgi:hypothetical protein